MIRDIEGGSGVISLSCDMRGWKCGVIRLSCDIEGGSVG